MSFIVSQKMISNIIINHFTLYHIHYLIDLEIMNVGGDLFMKNNVLLGALLCFIASVSWGAMFPVANDAFHYIDPFYFTIFRYSSVTIILLLLLYFKEGKKGFRLEGKGLSLWFFGTMAFAVYNLLIFWGQDLLGEEGVILASIMEALMPMISVVLLWIFKGNRPPLFTMLSILIAFIGVMLVITKGNITAFLSAAGNLFPAFLIFLAVVGWVVYTIGSSQFSHWSSLKYSALSCLFGTATALIIVLTATFIGAVPIPSAQTIQTVSPHLIFMIIFPGIIALLGWNIGVNILSPLNGILFINFVPVTTLVISAIQGYQVTSFDIVGTSFIIIAIVSNNILLRVNKKQELVQENEIRQLQKKIS